jgi:tetratricopeptide (TPR) repeat protein
MTRRRRSRFWTFTDKSLQVFRILFLVPALYVSRVVGRYFATRNYKYLLVGSPAIVVAGVMVATAVWQTQRPLASRLDRYRLAVGSAIRGKDWVAAELYSRKLLQLDVEDRQAEYTLAGVLQEKGDQKQALEVIKRLAPEDRIGYPPAHFAAVIGMIKKKEPLSKDELKRFEHHAKAAASDAKLRADAEQLLGQMYLMTHRAEEALASFQISVKDRPELRLAIAQLLYQANRPEEAKAELGRAVEFYRGRLVANPSDTESRVLLGRTMILAGNAQVAEAILRERFDKPDGARCREELASIGLAFYDSLNAGANIDSIAIRLQAIQLAIECDAKPQEIKDRLAKWNSTDAASVKELLASGKVGWIGHLILASCEKDAESVKMHLAQAERLWPGAGKFLGQN